MIRDRKEHLFLPSIVLKISHDGMIKEISSPIEVQLDLKDFAGSHVSTFIHISEITSWQEVISGCIFPNPLHLEVRVQDRKSQLYWMTGILHQLEANSSEYQLIGYDITQRKMESILLEGEHRILKEITSDTSMSEVLSRLSLLIESLFQGSYTSILLFNERSQHFQLGASPSLPVHFHRVLGEFVYLEEAAYQVAIRTRNLVAINDIHTQLNLGIEWNHLRLQSAWIAPVISRKGATLGIISIFSTDKANPSLFEEKMIKSLSNLAAIIIEHFQMEKEIQKRTNQNTRYTISKYVNLEKDLRFALERDEFILHYQPQVNVVSGEIIGAEALLRWNHPEHGLIPPSEFIPILDETGWIIPVGEWLIEKACLQQTKWIQKGLPAISVSVNISATQFQSNLLVDTVNQTIHKTGIDPQNFKIELTENMLIRNVRETHDILNRLRHVGIGVSIDDFGTGYSSLSYLKKFPIETIKIDRSFIRDIDNDVHDQAIVKAIIDMAKALDLDLIAEGTETDKQIRYLKNIGCINVQGYYFSKPVTAAEFESQLLLWSKLAKKLSWESSNVS